MARIVLDPEEVNQDVHVTLTDGETVVLADCDRAVLDRIARQLHVHRSSYAHALRDAAVGDQVAAGVLPVEEHAPLYLRVAALQAAAREGGRRRPPRSIDLAMLLQDRTWTASSGATQDLVSLTPTHRRNLLAWLERVSEDLQARAAHELDATQRDTVAPADPWVAGTPLYRRLAALRDAETARDRAMDQARQIARTLEFERSGEIGPNGETLSVRPWPLISSATTNSPVTGEIRCRTQHLRASTVHTGG